MMFGFSDTKPAVFNYQVGACSWISPFGVDSYQIYSLS